MILVFSITFVIGLVGGTIISLQYSQSFYVCLDFPEFSAIECLRYSRKIMKGSKGRRFYLAVSLSLIHIYKNDLCYQLFTEHGFTWGGNWKTMKDYQHFQKALPQK